MKRRTFLRLSSAALASLGLSACGAKSATSSSPSSEIPSDSYTDIVDGGDDSLGMTLGEAQQYSDFYNFPYFIHRADGLFYPIAVTLESTSSSTTFLDYEALNIYSEALTLHLSEGDELVYLSTSSSVPDSLSFCAVKESGGTFPAMLRAGSAPGLACLMYYDYLSASNSTPSRNEHYAGYWGGNDHPFYYNYYYATFSKYDPINGPDYDRLSSENHRITLNGASISDNIKACSGFDNFIQIDSYTREYGTSYYNHDDYYIISLNPLSAYEELTPSVFTSPLFQNFSAAVEWYEGTIYHTFTLKANCAYFIYDPKDYTSCALSLTPNGYAVVDLSALSNQPYSYILDCYGQSGDAHHAYLFIQP